MGKYHLNTGSNFNKHLPIKTFLLVNLFLFSVTQALIAQVSFNTATSIGVGTNPRSLTVTDINLDGKPDLLTANYNSNDVSVRFGNGLGGFSGTTSISVGTNPRGLTVADINLDGKPDLLVANENSNSVSVRIGDGAGGFSGTTEIAVQANPINVVVSDVNLDGKPDLLANNYNSNTVSVRLGDGLGGFSGSTNIAVGNAPISLTVTDINLDGNPDILVSRIGAGNNAVSVRLGDGLGGFTGTTNILVGSFPYKVVVADLNSDGKPDFLTSNLGANTVSVRLGDGVGGFSGSTEVTVGSGPISIAVGDVNSDSKLDFVVANRFGNNISVGLGDGTGTFSGTSVFAVGSDPWDIILADVNVDGRPDVLTANQNSNDASVLLNTSGNFITQWNLATAGSGPTELSFGTATSGTVNYTWQEISPGSATGSGSWSGSTLDITGLPVGATIRLQIAPTNFQQIFINNGPDRNRLTQVVKWGSTSWTSMSNAFSGCENLVFLTATDVPNLLGVMSMSSMFSGCKNLSSPSNINTWNTGSVTDMSSLFSGALGFNQNIGAWNTAAVTNMERMFEGTLFNQNIGSWNTAAVTNMAAMFKQTSFNNGGNGSINNWNTAAVTDMSQMFLSSPFNQNIGAWNTGAVTLMWKMFSASSFNQNIGAWNTAAVTNMQAMFGGASMFNNGGNSSINNWNTAAVTDMASMFYGSPFNQNIGSWNTAAVTNMQGMFGGASAFNQNIGAWNTGAVTNMSAMFSSSAFNQNIGAWNTGAVTDMSCMFCFTSAFNQNIGSWNTAASTNMQQMFYGATAFNQNLEAWTLNPGVNMVLMLENSGINCNNYSATLMGWSANPLTPNGRTLGASGRQYGTNAVAARTILTSTKGWTITGDTPSGAVCSPPASVPTITSFNPVSGPIGTTVSITGTNFSTTLANNIVYFGATKATVTIATTTQLTVTVPTGATYQPITVQVAGLTAYSSKRFFPTFLGGGSIDACAFDRKDFAAGLNPLGMMIKDFDGDGKGDIAITEVSSYQLSIYKNTSAIGVIDASTLSTPVSLATLPINPWSVASGDIDGDGKPDLVIANSLGSSISIYRNTSTPGNISFEPKVDFASGVAPWRTVVIDIDGDGKPEIVVSNRFSNSVSVFNNTSSTGSFSAATLASPVSFSAGTEPFDVSVGDLNGDDKPDIVALNNVSNTVSVFQNTTTSGVINSSSFSAKVDFPLGGTPYGLALADIDGDTKLDILATNSIANSTISVLQNVSGGTINASSFSPKVDFSVGLTPAHFGMADFNGDGKLDLAVSNSSSNTLTLLRNTASVGSITSASFASGVNIASLLNPAGIAAGDIDGDGRPEIAVGNFLSGSLSIYQNLVGLINPPTIASFTPSGAIGSSVTITGTNFSTPFSNAVSFNGVPATITASTATTLTVTVPVGATSGPLNVTVGCNTVNAGNFTVTVPGTITISPQPNSAAVCDGTTASFTIAASGTTNIAYQWQKFNGTVFTDINNGGGYSGATSTAFNINTTGNFGAGDYRCKVSGDLAPDVFSNTVTLTINPLPTQPTIPVQPVPVCGPSAVIPITATGGAPGQYRWYTVASGGTAIPGETNATYSPTVTGASANFFVSINDGACESTRTSVTATLVTTPAPTATGSSACPGGIFTLTASGGTNGQYKWYTDATGGTPITGAVNGSFTTAALSSTTNFYVTNTASGCESTRTPVTATVITSGCAPNIPAQTYNLPIEGKVEVDLKQLITTSGILDVNTIKVIKQPASGASASIVNGVLTIDYKGKPFVGREIIIIEACTTTGQCSQQTFEIEVAGDIIVFNGISPNGDGLNEFLKIQNIELLPETKNNQVMIYNRWGDEVFKVSDYNNADRVFDGDTNSGNKLPSGIYFYKIVMPNAGKTMTGFISLKH